jgi:hypothetical protein
MAADVFGSQAASPNISQADVRGFNALFLACTNRTITGHHAQQAANN